MPVLGAVPGKLLSGSGEAETGQSWESSSAVAPILELKEDSPLYPWECPDAWA